MVFAVKPMPRPKSLELEDVARAALAVLDREGLSALTMRNVAVELGVGTMSLYRYVRDREHLECLIVEEVLAAVDSETSARLGAAQRIHQLCERARAAVAKHPAVVPLLLVHRQQSRQSMRWGEALLTVLSEAGFNGKRRVIAFRSLLSYVIGAISVEQLGPLDGAGTRAIAELPTTEYPRLTETARHAGRIDRESEFRQGLVLLLRGLMLDGA